VDHDTTAATATPIPPDLPPSTAPPGAGARPPRFAARRSRLLGSLLDHCTFPDPVNELSARVVAAGVVTLVAAAMATETVWLVALLAYGFLARVLAGPTWSPLGQAATRIVTPLLPVEGRLVPGPPKRFAQAIGACSSLTALALAIAGQWTATEVVLGLLGVAASLEAAAGFCLGCTIFAALMARGIIPADACPRCAPTPQPVQAIGASTTPHHDG
jgi:hypothetical protein